MVAGKQKTSKRPKWQAGGPFLAAAVICERVLAEADNVWSAMRIVDGITMQDPIAEAHPPALEMMLAPNLTILVMVKSGSFQGK